MLKNKLEEENEKLKKELEELGMRHAKIVSEVLKLRERLRRIHYFSEEGD